MADDPGKSYRDKLNAAADKALEVYNQNKRHKTSFSSTFPFIVTDKDARPYPEEDQSKLQAGWDYDPAQPPLAPGATAADRRAHYLKHRKPRMVEFDHAKKEAARRAWDESQDEEGLPQELQATGPWPQWRRTLHRNYQKANAAIPYPPGDPMHKYALERNKRFYQKALQDVATPGKLGYKLAQEIAAAYYADGEELSPPGWDWDKNQDLLMREYYAEQGLSPDGSPKEEARGQSPTPPKPERD